MDIINELYYKGYDILHNQLLQQQIAQEEERKSIYNSLTSDIRTTLDDMSYGIAVKEGLDPYIVKQRMVSKVNMLSKDESYYLVAELAILIDISLNKGEDISDKNTQKDFITFLIRLFY